MGRVLPISACCLGAMLLVAGCGGGPGGPGGGRFQRGAEPRTLLDARPHGGKKNCRPGRYDLAGGKRKALMLVTRQSGARRRGLLLALHGAGRGGALSGLTIFRNVWKTPGLVLVAPAAAGRGWSLGSVDLDFVDRALGRAFARCRIDPDRVAVGGFSSGAGLALWLGLTNGDLFHDLVVLSGAANLPSNRVGKPHVFVAHGIHDDVIPIGLGGDAIARSLRGDGYDVVYRRFDGGHQVRHQLAGNAVRRALVPRRRR